MALLSHAKSASGSKPSGAWEKRARPLIEAIGKRDFLSAATYGWFSLVGNPASAAPARLHSVLRVLDPTLISERNADVLKGLAWCVGAMGNPSAARVVANLAEVCFKKIPQMGARCPRVGNACLTAPLLLKGHEPVGEAQQAAIEGEAAFRPFRGGEGHQSIGTVAGNLAGRSGGDERSDLWAGPERDDEPNARHFRADLEIVGTHDVALRWRGPAGKTVKSVPAEVKRNHGQELKELQRVQKDMQKMLPAQAERIERLLLDGAS